MKHQPKQLALLISLIGVGVSPLALAKTDVRIVGMDLSTSGIALDVRDGPDARDVAALAQARWFAEWARQTGERTLTLPEPWDPLRAAAVRLPGDALADPSAVQPEPELTDSVVDTTAGLGVSSAAQPDAQPAAPPMSAQAARLWESMFAGMPDEPEALDKNAGLSSVDSTPQQADRPVGELVDAWFTLDSQVATAEPDSQPNVVATQSSMVLHSLQAILSDERDEVGAIKVDPNDARASTQAGRVLSALSGLSSHHAKPETPAARRAIKRAAAKLRAEAAMARAALTIPAVTLAAPEAMQVDIDLMQPLIAEHAAAAAPEGDDEQAPLAMETGPWPGVMGVDIDLAVPFVVEPFAQPTEQPAASCTAAAPSVSDDKQAPLATETELWPGLMDVDIDLSQPFAAEKPAATTPIGDDDHAAVAMDSAAAPEAAHVDIDLTLPIDAEQAAATPPEGDRKSGPDLGPNPFGSELVAVSEKSLDAVRGGFVTNGLNISFGIERAVYINGSLVTTTSLNVTDLGRFHAGRDTPVLTSGTFGLIQSGAGNTVAPGTFSSGSIGTVIQNTLDGQKIQNVTVINATTNSLGLLKGMNMESSMRGAISDSLRR